MSLLQFAKDFAKLKLDLAVQPVPDLQLLCLVDFWPSLADYSGKSLYRSYLDEYVPLLLHLVSAGNLSDLTMRELLRLQDVLADLSALESVNDKLKDQRRLVSQELARRYFYVGAVEDALTICASFVPWAADLAVCPRSATLDDESVSPGLGDNGVVGVTWRSSTGSSHARTMRSQELPEQSRPLDLHELSEFEAFESIIEHISGRDNSLDVFLSNLHDDWIGDRDAIYHDRINALFVDKDDAGRAWRGRMKSLTGKVELFGKSATTDEITFDNQIKSPDDPFIGVAYHSLEAVRQSMKRAGFNRQSAAFYHAYFAVENSQQIFTGDSIGLATGLLTYAQLLKPEIMRQDKFIGADIAVTGGIDDSGAVTSINDDTLKLKIERAFFSPLRHIVVPDENLSAAREHIERLREKYPRRRLKLITVESLTDAIENRNIIREEKVCIGEFVAKKAYRYSRTAKLQIPILLVLAYFLLCMIYPKAWMGFDWNPHSIRIAQNEIVAFNQNYAELWSKSFECAPLNQESQWCVHDLDGDGKQEVLFLPSTPANASCKVSAYLHAYDCWGDSIFTVACPIIGETPFDTSVNQLYSVQPIEVAESERGTVIVTQVYSSHKARTHFKFWNPLGERLGWYINAGHCAGVGTDFASDAEGRLHFLTYNNLTDCACLLVVKPDSCEGASPPHTGFLSNARIGTQLHYVLFPRTDINLVSASVYNHPEGIYMLQDGRFRADIRETDSAGAVLEYYFDRNHRVIEVRPTDGFKVVRKRLKLPLTELSYFENLKNEVLYWRDSGWVSEGELRATEKY